MQAAEAGTFTVRHTLCPGLGIQQLDNIFSAHSKVRVDTLSMPPQSERRASCAGYDSA